MLSEQECRAIRDYAAGVSINRALVITIFRQHLDEFLTSADPPLELKFVSELDSPCPDLALRAQYRKLLLEQD
jgi:hypothetical protein